MENQFLVFFLSGRLRQVLLYTRILTESISISSGMEESALSSFWNILTVLCVI